MSDTPRTDAVKEPEAISKLRAKAVAIAANGSTVIAWPENNHIINYIEELKHNANQLERELNESKEQLSNWKHKFEVVGKPIPVDSYHHWTGEICEARKDRDQWKAMAQELAHGIVAFRDFGSAKGGTHYDVMMSVFSRFNALNKGHAFIPPHQALAVALKRYAIHRETCTRDMHNVECSCGLDALIKQLDELSPQ